MGVGLGGWLRRSPSPAGGEHRPEGDHAGEDEHPEPPRTLAGVRVDPARPPDHERQRKHHADGNVQRDDADDENGE